VQDYSLMRHKAAVEVQMSESLLAAEEEMMNAGQPAARKAPDIYNVFKPDGTGTWSDTVSMCASAWLTASRADRPAMSSARGSISLSCQSGSSSRVRSTPHQARAKLLLLRACSAVEDALSDPFNATVADYDMAVLGIRADEDAGVRAGTASRQRLVCQRRRLQATSPTRTTQAYVFDDPTRAVALAEALDLQDEVDAGTHDGRGGVCAVWPYR
jgi:hypothetical protein